MSVIWHVISPDDHLTRDNGSAVLTVAKQLVANASHLGHESKIVGGLDVPCDLPVALPLLPNQVNGRLTATRTNLMRLATGSSESGAFRESLAQHRGKTPEVIALHNLPWLGGAVQNAFPEAKIVLYVHNEILRRVPRLRAQSVLSRFDAIVCVSTPISDRLRALAPAHPNIVTNLNGSPEPVSASPEKLYDVGYLGRLTPEKGVHLLLEGVGQASRHLGGKPRLAIAGSHWFFGSESSPTPYENRLKALGSHPGMDVQFVGRLVPGQVLSFLSSCRVVVIPSMWLEPCSLVLLEALASDAAVVATMTGGTPEVAQDGALLVNPRAQEISSAVARLLSHDGQRLDLSARGQRRAGQLTWLSSTQRFLSASGIE